MVALVLRQVGQGLGETFHDFRSKRGKIRTVRLHGLKPYHVALAAAMALAACSTTPSGSFCSISEPIRLSDATVASLTDEEVERVLAQNLKGKKLCGWRE
jgi:hypothetical protein